ncbi:MAG: hypothetical protein ACREV0_15305 [Burkholderiales bacterium]
MRRCFHEYGLVTDDRGEYSALYRPYHLIGLELAISVASVALRRTHRRTECVPRRCCSCRKARFENRRPARRRRRLHRVGKAHACR